jgi:hypothetical protein
MPEISVAQENCKFLNHTTKFTLVKAENMACGVLELRSSFQNGKVKAHIVIMARTM